MDTLPKDIFEFPEHINVSYDATLAEPNFYKETFCGKAMRPLSKCLGVTYDSIQIIIYFILSATFGALLTILWGVIFGIVNFITIWVAHPFAKIALSIFRCFYICSRSCTRMCWDPCFESAAIMYTRIYGGFHVTVEKREVGVSHQVSVNNM